MHNEIDKKKRFGRSRRAIYLMLLLVALTGCNGGVVDQLQGGWMGRPDTAAAVAAREAERFGEQPTDEDLGPPTDWEQYDVGVRLEFVDETHVEMSLADGSQPVEGTWQVVESSPSGWIIEIETSPADDKKPIDSSNTAAADTPAKGECRRFNVEPDYQDGHCTGFRLSELGADRQLGAMYFRRD